MSGVCLHKELSFTDLNCSNNHLIKSNNFTATLGYYPFSYAPHLLLLVSIHCHFIFSFFHFISANKAVFIHVHNCCTSVNFPAVFSIFDELRISAEFYRLGDLGILSISQIHGFYFMITLSIGRLGLTLQNYVSAEPQRLFPN